MKTSFKIAVAIFVLIFGGAQPVAAESVLKPLLIVEVQTSSVANASEEFVEIYNPNAEIVDVTGWKLQYRSASAVGETAWSTKATFSCANSEDTCKVYIAPRGRLLVASYDVPDFDDELRFNAGLAGAGGQLRLLQPAAEGGTDTQHDLLGYGTAATAEGGFAASAPQKGQSLKRVCDEDGLFLDTNVNRDDFIVSDAPSPTGDDLPVPTPPAEEPPDEEPGRGGLEPDYLPISITEVLPDPASPQTDAEDEFIELYNSNDQLVSLKGYVLQTGNDFRYKYVLGDLTIEARSYIVIKSAQSKLSLSNSGSPVRILTPAGEVVDEVPSYGEAKEGQS